LGAPRLWTTHTNNTKQHGPSELRFDLMAGTTEDRRGERLQAALQCTSLVPRTDISSNYLVSIMAQRESKHWACMTAAMMHWPHSRKSSTNAGMTHVMWEKNITSACDSFQQLTCHPSFIFDQWQRERVRRKPWVIAAATDTIWYDTYNTAKWKPSNSHLHFFRFFLFNQWQNNQWQREKLLKTMSDETKSAQLQEVRSCKKLGMVWEVRQECKHYARMKDQVLTSFTFLLVIGFQ